MSKSTDSMQTPEPLTKGHLTCIVVKIFFWGISGAVKAITGWAIAIAATVLLATKLLREFLMEQLSFISNNPEKTAVYFPLFQGEQAVRLYV